MDQPARTDPVLVLKRTYALIPEKPCCGDDKAMAGVIAWWPDNFLSRGFSFKKFMLFLS
jgi:hypothetical protein